MFVISALFFLNIFILCLTFKREIVLGILSIITVDMVERSDLRF